MNKEELIERLKGHEWNDIEFKKAQRGVPQSAYETVSAFCNTGGGWLVFGVLDRNGNYEIVGVIEVDKVQNDFLSVLRSGKKLNRVISVKEGSIQQNNETVLVFHVPEAPRQDKPIYLSGDIRRSYIRKGAGDERCTQAEIERFLRDASAHRYDGELIEELDAEDFFDKDSVAWYRRIFHKKNPGRHETFSDVEFLNEWGFIVEKRDRLIPTLAAVLLFGQGKYVRQILPRAVVDYQLINTDFEKWSPEKRWHDRVVIEENIIQAWQILVERYMKHAERPFDLDATTMRRNDAPPDYISFREAAINLLIHQDYGDHSRKPVIKFFRDRTIFWNPGDAFATTDQLLEPTEKEVRNPAIVNAFRRIGLSDQAGTGIRSIFRGWRELGNIPPVILNNKEDKTFGLSLMKQELLTERQQLFQAALGVRLDQNQADLFAYACRSGKITLTDAKAVTGQTGPDSRKLLDSLVVQALLKPVEDGFLYAVADHLRDRFQEETADQVPDQVDRPSRDLVTDQVKALSELSDTQRQIVMMCEVPRSMKELMGKAGLTHRTFFRQKYLQPLINGGVIRLTNPENPQASNQKYVLTEAGLNLKAKRSKKKK